MTHAPSLVCPPLTQRLAARGLRRILLAGCGGGFDVYSAVPVYLALRAAGAEPLLASLSFMELSDVLDDPAWPDCWRLDASTIVESRYHPEVTLARWLEARGDPSPVWTFPRTGTAPLLAAYRTLVARERIEAVVLVDGGTDSLLRGDEQELGTPLEDATSIVTIADLGLPAWLVNVGFGVDHFHGVCHAQWLEAVSALTREGALLGVSSLVRGTAEVDAWLELVDFANQEMPGYASIVCNSVKSAIEGHHGDHHATRRTEGSRLWINPLMPLVWAFDLEPVARRLLYRDAIRGTRTMRETAERLFAFRRGLELRPGEQLPI